MYIGGGGLRMTASQNQTTGALGSTMGLWTTENNSDIPTQSITIFNGSLQPASAKDLGGTTNAFENLYIDKVTLSSPTNPPTQKAGSGTPEGVVFATKGSTYQREDGGAGTCFYVKESGTGNTGWVAK